MLLSSYLQLEDRMNMFIHVFKICGLFKMIMQCASIFMYWTHWCHLYLGEYFSWSSNSGLRLQIFLVSKLLFLNMFKNILLLLILVPCAKGLVGMYFKSLWNFGSTYISIWMLITTAAFNFTEKEIIQMMH